MRPYLRVANVFENRIDTTDVMSMNYTPVEFLRYRLKPGDALLNEGQSPELLGRPALFRGEVKDACFQNTLIRFRAYAGVLPEYALLVFRWFLHTQAFLSLSRWTTNIAHLGAGRFAAMVMPLAPSREQRELVDQFAMYESRLDAATAALERARRNLKRYRASVLQAAVEGRLVPTEAELARKEGRIYEPAGKLLERILIERRRQWIEREAEKARAAAQAKAAEPWTAQELQAALEKARAAAAGRYVEPAAPDTAGLPELPEGWCWASVDQLAIDVCYGTSAKTDGTLDAGVPVLRMGNIVDGRVDLSDLKFLPADHDEFPRLLLSRGDLLFNRTNSAELVGKSAVYHGKDHGCGFASYLVRVRFGHGVSPNYIAAFLNSSSGRSWIATVVSQQVGQANVNSTKLRACIVPLPPGGEQTRVLAAMERLLSVAVEAEEECLMNASRLARLRRSILRLAFEGKLVDQDPSDEPASVLLDRIKAQRAAGESGAKGPMRTSRRKATTK